MKVADLEEITIDEFKASEVLGVVTGNISLKEAYKELKLPVKPDQPSLTRFTVFYFGIRTGLTRRVGLRRS